MSTSADDGWQFAGACEAPGRIQGSCVGHRITIEAPPEMVWDFLADFEGWRTWNPLYGAVAGRIEEGAPLSFTSLLPGMKPRKGKAVVRTVLHNELIEYAISAMAGLVKVFRFIEVEELSPVRCRVANGEITGGPLGRVASRAMSGKLAQGLKDMNEALKKVAERKWQGRAA